MRPRVAGEVLAGPELSRVDEDGHDHPVVLRDRAVDQRAMAGVQGTHGRHHPDRQAGGAPRRGPPAELRGGRE